jgi:hypothetical protein
MQYQWYRASHSTSPKAVLTLSLLSLRARRRESSSGFETLAAYVHHAYLFEAQSTLHQKEARIEIKI